MAAGLATQASALTAAAAKFATRLSTEFGEALLTDAVLPPAAYRAAAALGLSAIEVPAEHGGLGLAYRAKLAAAMALARVSMPFSFSLINTHNAANKLARHGSAAVIETHLSALLACERFGATALTEPHAGSDFSAIETTAERVDGGWRLSGEKAWITNAAFADLFITYAQTDASRGWRGIACFLVEADRPGFERAPPTALYGANAIGTGGFRLTGYVAPDDHLIHPPGEAFKAALGSINGARTYVAGMCCALVETALEQAIAYGGERRAFGRRLLDHQGLRWQLADVATELEAARALTERAAALVEASSPDAVLAAAHAKKFAARMAEPALTACVQSMGANGLLKEHGMGLRLACARVAHYVDGSTEMQNERIAALLFDA